MAVGVGAGELRELADDTDGAGDGFDRLRRFLNSLPLHLVLDHGRLAVVHAAVRDTHLRWGSMSDTERAALSGRQRREIEGWALYGPSHGPRDDDGFPQRVDWVPEYTGQATVVRGHVVHEQPESRNGVVSVDTGAGEGWTLTAMSWPSASFTTVEVHPHRQQHTAAAATAVA